jgi:hypothetical protein
MITKVLKLGLEGLVLKDLMVSAEQWVVMSVTSEGYSDRQILGQNKTFFHNCECVCDILTHHSQYVLL